MPITAERLEVEVQADTAKAGRDLAQFGRTADATGARGDAAGRKTGAGFAAGAAMVRAAAGAMATAVAGKTIMAASDLNEVLSKSGVVFGPQAKIVNDAAQKMADQFGISKTEYLDAATGIGLVGKAAGLTRKDAAGLSTDFAALAADASSFYNVPITDALAAMKSGLVGESEPMRQFGVLLSEAAVQQEAYRLGIAKTGAELTEQQKVQARASLIQKGMKDASGDLARTQESVANRLREIRGRLTNFAADMGTKALPAVEKFLNGVIKLPGQIRAVYDTIRGWVKENQTLATVIGMTVAALTTFYAVGKIIALAKAAGLAMKAWAIGQMALNKAMFANPIVIVVAAIAALVAAAYIAYKRFAGFRAVVDAVGAALKGGFVAALDWVKAKWQEWGPAIMATLTAMKNHFMAFVAFILPLVKNWAVALWGVIKGVWTAISAVVKGALSVIKGIVNVVMGVIRGDWGRVWKGLQQIVGGVWGAIKGVVRGGVQVVKSLVSGGVNAVKHVWGAAWDAVRGALSRAWDAITGAVSRGVGKVTSTVTGLKGRITGALSSAGSWLLSAGQDLIRGMIQGVKNMAGNLASSATEVVSGAVSAAKRALGIRSPSRVFKAIGIDTIRGLIVGLQAKKKDARKKAADVVGDVIAGFRKAMDDRTAGGYLKAMASWVGRVFDGRTEKALLARIKGASARTRRLLLRETAITRRLAAAEAAKGALVDEKRGFVDAMRQGISGQANVLNAGDNAATIRSSLEAQVGKAREFAANLKRLAGMGYPRSLIAQVAGAGIEGGAAVAKALASASGSDAAGIRQAFNQINSLAASQSQALGNMLYDPGIRAADGLIAGLKKRRKDVEATLVQIAKGMSTALKRALGIRSPSRVMAALAGFIPAGIAKGIRDRSKVALKAAGAMARGVTVATQGGFQGPGVPPFGPRGPASPAATGGFGGGGDVHFHFNTHNPKAEPQSRTTNKALDRVASLGLV